MEVIIFFINKFLKSQQKIDDEEKTDFQEKSAVLVRFYQPNELLFL